MGILSDLFFGGAERRAAKKQSKALDRAIAEQREARTVARADLSPFRQAGTDILSLLGEFVREGPETELERTRGFDQIQQSAAAGRKLRSGDTLTGLVDFNSALNARNRGQRFNELLSLANLGQTSAAGQANVSFNTGRDIAQSLASQGDARAAGIIGGANTARSTIGSLASFLGTKFG